MARPVIQIMDRLTKSKSPSSNSIEVRKNTTTTSLRSERDQHLVAIRHYPNQKSRANRPRRQREALINPDHTFENKSRREVEEFRYRLREIRGNEENTKWKHDGREERRKCDFVIRQLKFNHYEANNTTLAIAKPSDTEHRPQYKRQKTKTPIQFQQTTRKLNINKASTRSE